MAKFNGRSNIIGASYYMRCVVCELKSLKQVVKPFSVFWGLIFIAFWVVPKEYIPVIAIAFLALVTIISMERVVKSVIRENDLSTIRQKEKDIALHANFLTFYGVAYPVFVDLFVGKCDSNRNLIFWLGLIIFSIVMLFVRKNSEIMWKCVRKREQREKKKEEKKWEQQKSQLGCPCSVSRESCSCPQRRWPPRKS